MLIVLAFVNKWRSAASQFLLVFVVVLKRLMTACAGLAAGLAAGCLDPASHLQSLPEALAVFYSFVYFYYTLPSRTIQASFFLSFRILCLFNVPNHLGSF
jgi:hypothetical protein